MLRRISGLTLCILFIAWTFAGAASVSPPGPKPNTTPLSAAPAASGPSVIRQQVPPGIPVITVKSPASGDKWAKLQTHQITWNYKGDPGAAVDICLMKGPLRVKTLIQQITASAGTYSWTPDKELTTGDGFSILVQNSSNPAFKGESKAFSITPPAISSVIGPVRISDKVILQNVRFTKPVQGVVWRAGDPHDIEWEYLGNPPGQAKILLMKGEQVIRTISNGQTWGQSGKGWIIPYYMPQDVPSGNGYTIKAVSTTNENYKGSSGDFTIEPYAGLVITQPNINASLVNWPVGSTHSIAWNYVGNCGSHVKVTLHGGVNDGWKVYTLADSWPVGTNGSGNFTWTVPSANASGIHWISGNQYLIMVAGVENGQCWNWTGKFTVNP